MGFQHTKVSLNLITFHSILFILLHTNLCLRMHLFCACFLFTLSPSFALLAFCFANSFIFLKLPFQLQFHLTLTHLPTTKCIAVTIFQRQTNKQNTNSASNLFCFLPSQRNLHHFLSPSFTFTKWTNAWPDTNKIKQRAIHHHILFRKPFESYML